MEVNAYEEINEAQRIQDEVHYRSIPYPHYPSYQVTWVHEIPVMKWWDTCKLGKADLHLTTKLQPQVKKDMSYQTPDQNSTWEEMIRRPHPMFHQKLSNTIGKESNHAKKM